MDKIDWEAYTAGLALAEFESETPIQKFKLKTASERYEARIARIDRMGQSIRSTFTHFKPQPQVGAK